MNAEIKRIFDNFKVNDVSIEVAHLRYKGNNKTFITWMILNDIPILSADDEPIYCVTQVDIDVFSDKNYLNIIAKVKEKMKENDWIWVEDSSEMYEDDTGLYHKTITFEKERRY